MSLRIGIDTGGTFTDFIVSDGRSLRVFKILSTPRNASQAIFDGLQRLSLTQSIAEIVHGSTVATNALLERKGARTALLTTEGFEDILEIGRQNRPALYSLRPSRPEPLVPARLRLGVLERTLDGGEILIPADLAKIPEIEQLLRAEKIESVAVCFLFSFANPVNELAVGQALASGPWMVSLSHQILPEFREYERTSTTVVNAYLAPVMGKYLHHIKAGLESIAVAKARFRVMQSNGGSMSAAVGGQEPVRTILSGPAAGVVGASRVAAKAGFARIITFDMGGTSTDVCLVDNKIHTTHEASIAHCPIGIPTIDIHTVGAGGGSIARVDTGGALAVGPESAGADPGPICYGRGDSVTVTDANVLLGRIDPACFLGGAMQLHTEKLSDHFTRLAAALGLRAGNRAAALAAQGVIDVANARMEQAIRVISVERGHDTRDFTLVTFGGAGGLHAADLARALAIPQVLIPQNPGLLSALGTLLADITKDFSQTCLIPQSRARWTLLESTYRRMEKQAGRAMTAEGCPRRTVKCIRQIDLRYLGQSYELTLPFSRRCFTDFHVAHQKRYGYSDRNREVEAVTLRVRAVSATPKVGLRSSLRRRARGEKAEPAKIGRTFFSGRYWRARLYRRESLCTADRLTGPCIVAEYSATTAVPPDYALEVDALGNLLLHRK